MQRQARNCYLQPSLLVYYRLLAPVCLHNQQASQPPTSTETRTCISCPENTYSSSRISRRVFTRSRDLVLLGLVATTINTACRASSCLFSLSYCLCHKKKVDRRVYTRVGGTIPSSFVQSYARIDISFFSPSLSPFFFSVMLNALVHGKAACPAFSSCFFLLPLFNSFNTERE